MDILVAGGAEGNQVVLGIVSQPAPGVNVVDLEVCAPPAVLAAPPIALQHLVAELAVRVRVEAEAGPPWE